MKYLMIAGCVGIAAAFIYLGSGPSPRLTFGDSNGELIDYSFVARFSPDGKTVIARGYRPVDDPMRIHPFNEILKLYDAKSGQMIREFAPPNPNGRERFSQVEFTPDGAKVLACGNELGLLMWERDSGKLIRQFFAKPTYTDAFDVSADDSQVLVSTMTKLFLWDLKNGEMKKEIPARDIVKYNARFHLVKLSKDGSHVLLNSGLITTIWDFPKLALKLTLSSRLEIRFKDMEFRLPEKCAFRGVHLSPIEESLFWSSRDGRIEEFDLATTKVKNRYQLPDVDKDIHYLRFSVKGDRVITSGSHGEARVYSFPECKELKRMLGYGDVQISPDSRTALTFTRDGQIMLWDLEK